MKFTQLALAGLCSLALGCGDSGSTDGGSASAYDDVPAVEVPSEEQAAADAEAAINESNADAELDKLAAEIEADG